MFCGKIIVNCEGFGMKLLWGWWERSTVEGGKEIKCERNRGKKKGGAVRMCEMKYSS